LKSVGVLIIAPAVWCELGKVYCTQQVGQVFVDVGIYQWGMSFDHIRIYQFIVM